MNLEQIAQHCYDLTESYLNLSPDVSDYIGVTQESIRKTKKCILEDIFSRWNPFNGDISFSYNGGKDCQVLLIIYLGCVWEHFKKEEHLSFPMEKLPCAFIALDECFVSLDNFIDDTAMMYNLQLYKSPKDLDNKIKMADAFGTYLKKFPSTKAILIGIRHTDPFGDQLISIEKTDSHWPLFMRLQPILHWNLCSIWSFLIYSNQPICGLYAMGFTSLGSVQGSLPNPILKMNSNSKEKPPINHFKWEIMNSYKNDHESISNENIDSIDDLVNLSTITSEDLQCHSNLNVKYYPGWYLVDAKYERCGRIKNK